VRIDLLSSRELVVFTTRDFARAAGTSVAAATRQLTRLKRDNAAFVRLTRGVWANTGHPYFSVFACVPVLLGGEQGYVSFLSALHLHGAISQIPANVQVATTGHTRRLRTPVATFEFLQLKPELAADGVVWSDSQLPYRIATVEKALLDTFYIATRKRRRFAKLPELELEPAGFSGTRYRALRERLPVPRPVAIALARRSLDAGIDGSRVR
jgi:predicted transcriptional regulator of viral defense system